VPTALAVIDMFNTYDHEDAEVLVESAEKVVPKIAELLERARQSEAEVVFVNDNYGDWSASGKQLVDAALEGKRPDLIEPLVPREDESFVVKARHTIFFETPLGYLIQQKEIDRLILAGQVTEQCILYSALDAYVRHIPISVPRDAVAHIDEGLAGAALKMMESNMDADLGEAEACEL
jgi:nicotinamidase-related amidase